MFPTGLSWCPPHFPSHSHGRAGSLPLSIPLWNICWISSLGPGLAQCTYWVHRGETEMQSLPSQSLPFPAACVWHQGGLPVPVPSLCGLESPWTVTSARGRVRQRSCSGHLLPAWAEEHGQTAKAREEARSLAFPCGSDTFTVPFEVVKVNVKHLFPSEALGPALPSLVQPFFSRRVLCWQRWPVDMTKERQVTKRKDVWPSTHELTTHLLGEAAFIQEHKAFQEKQSIKLVRGVTKIRQASGKAQEIVKFQRDLWRRTSTTGLIPKWGWRWGWGDACRGYREREGRGGKKTCMKCRL